MLRGRSVPRGARESADPKLLGRPGALLPKPVRSYNAEADICHSDSKRHGGFDIGLGAETESRAETAVGHNACQPSGSRGHAWAAACGASDRAGLDSIFKPLNAAQPGLHSQKYRSIQKAMELG